MNLGIFEIDNDQITLIEWPKIIKNYIFDNFIDLSFQYSEDFKERFLTFSSTNNISFLNEIEKK